MCIDRCGHNPLFKLQATAPPSRTAHLEADLHDELKILAKKLGPLTASNLAAFVDLGLSDDDIGRYFGLSSFRVGQLRQAWRIAV